MIDLVEKLTIYIKENVYNDENINYEPNFVSDLESKKTTILIQCLSSSLENDGTIKNQIKITIKDKDFFKSRKATHLLFYNLLKYNDVLIKNVVYMNIPREIINEGKFENDYYFSFSFFTRGR